MPEKLVHTIFPDSTAGSASQGLELPLKNTQKLTLRQELINGLSAQKKYVASKFFYNKQGTQLFNWISQLPEYYLTRTEKQILKQYSKELFGQLSHVNIIELGSGNSAKISMVLDAIPSDRHLHIHYYPVDVNQSSIQESTQELNKHFPDVGISGIVTDLNWLETLPNDQPRIICFFGSTFGNLEQHESQALLNKLQDIMNPGDQLILGLDLLKPINILERAYNDSQRITEAFNRNILRVCNQILRTDICPSNYEHRAFFNPEKSRIEMHLIAATDMLITSPYLNGYFEVLEGESIHTENSYKYSLNMVEALAVRSKLSLDRIFYDDQKWFAIVQLIK